MISYRYNIDATFFIIDESSVYMASFPRRPFLLFFFVEESIKSSVHSQVYIWPCAAILHHSISIAQHRNSS